jgi:hypothetical protein
LRNESISFLNIIETFEAIDEIGSDVMGQMIVELIS